MNSLVILLLGVAVLALGYLFYGRWLAKVWGVDPTRATPAHTMTDGMDYIPAKAPVLMGHHFSSIAGAGPINGPIQAAVFGWVPVFLWVLVGGIFFGAVHDYGSLFASIRNKGQSIGEIISSTMGVKAKRLFIVFSYLTLILVVAAFGSIVANTFRATYDASGALDIVKSTPNARTAMISILFMVIAIAFGFAVYRRNAPLSVSTICGVISIVVIMVVGFNYHPIYLSYNTWMVIVGIYITIASVAPVWILLQPRDYLSSFLLYFMMGVAFVGIIGSALMGHGSLEMPAFTGFNSSIGPMFPALFITIACGAISGFHSLVGSGTSSKQIDNEKDALPIAFGGMLIECALAVMSLISMAFIWNNIPKGATPPMIFATGISKMISVIPVLKGAESVVFSMLILAVSAFCLTSLDTATRLARYMFQEFWLQPGEDAADVKGFRKVLINPVFATVVTVVAGIGLGLGGYVKVWPLFGAANQLLAAIGLMAVAAWLGDVGKQNKMFYIPMVFMLVVTIVSLISTIMAKVATLSTLQGSDVFWTRFLIALAVLLVVLAIVLAVTGFKTMSRQGKK